MLPVQLQQGQALGPPDRPCQPRSPRDQPPPQQQDRSKVKVTAVSAEAKAPGQVLKRVLLSQPLPEGGVA